MYHSDDFSGGPRFVRLARVLWFLRASSVRFAGFAGLRSVIQSSLVSARPFRLPMDIVVFRSVESLSCSTLCSQCQEMQLRPVRSNGCMTLPGNQLSNCWSQLRSFVVRLFVCFCVGQFNPTQRDSLAMRPSALGISLAAQPAIQQGTAHRAFTARAPSYRSVCGLCFMMFHALVLSHFRCLVVGCSDSSN